MNFTFDENFKVKTIIIYAAGWDLSEGTLDINGKTIELTPLKNLYVVKLDNTSNQITIKTTSSDKRALLFSLGFYGPNAELPEIFEVAFDLDYIGAPTIDSIYVEDGAKVGKPTDPTKEGYDFVEWQLGGVAFDINDPITQNITLVAIWESNENRAKLEYKGVSNGNMVDGNNAATVGLDSLIFTVTSDKQSGSNHVGLNTSGQGQLRLYQTGGGNILTIEIDDAYVITSIEIKFLKTGSGADAKIMLGSFQVLNTTAANISNKTILYDSLNITDFSIQNVHSSNVQLWIEYIEITFEPVTP